MAKPKDLDGKFKVVATVKSVAHYYVGTKFETLIGTFFYVFPKGSKPSAGNELVIYFDRNPEDPEKKVLWVENSKASKEAPVATAEA